jgi:hypothetical protein
MTGQRQKICVQDVGAKISIFVISTDPSETIRMRGGQVVLEGCYQLFINSTLNSFCGQLKEKHFY